ncbi:AraC family transcriptional regulator [Devosia sp. A16]|uniref:AraC family transcriptional regulator n=1 Tax=Devosia sp. A16 TaxID=1736675 RepID=UPI0006D7B7D7|nr:AraC family transcriptional regulator [Devosia sp. A16]
MSAVAKTLWIIESRFGMPLTLEEMAMHAGVSRFHLSRIFPQATGYSISAYLRGRRLTEAAKALAAGAPDILAVALDAGYGSHEAFTRAFRELIGLTPDQVRRRGRLDDLPLLEPLRIDHEVRVELCAPRIETRPPMRIAGLLARHVMNGDAAIPAQWQRFNAYVGNVPGEVAGVYYGLSGHHFADTDECEYMAGMEVRETAELPREFTLITVPAQRYARLAHRGHITTIRSTIEAIFAQWLPTSGYRKKYAPWSFIEYYGPDFNERTGLGTVEIWIALED